MNSLNPISASHHGTHRTYVHPSLNSCSHVFLRTDSVKPPLTPPYTGPHKVITRNDKTFVLEINGKNITVSIDRIKPAFILCDSPAPIPIVQPDSTEELNAQIKQPVITRSGRHVHFPQKTHHCNIMSCFILCNFCMNFILCNLCMYLLISTVLYVSPLVYRSSYSLGGYSVVKRIYPLHFFSGSKPENV